MKLSLAYQYILERWSNDLKLIFPDINDHIISILEELLFSVYQEKGITFNTTEREFQQRKVNEWPTLNDLYLLASKKFKEKPSRTETEIIGYLKRLSSLGAYGHLWNGYTTLDVDYDKFLIFDTYNLKNDKKIINAQLFLMLAFLENEIKKNKDKNDLLPASQQEWICLAVDEAHLLIDKKNQIALQFLYEMAKRIRKYHGILYIVTQNINDFVGDDSIKKQAEGIMNNCTYQFVHKLESRDLQNYNDLFKCSGGLNEFELQAISTASLGECLFSIGSNERSFLKIIASDVEASAWVRDETKIEEKHKMLNGYLHTVGKQEEIN